jgi:outer membrane protein OmpA-like peptidoglycan-associated protein/tetratricopeptide (TPR) repeat protein
MGQTQLDIEIEKAKHAFEQKRYNTSANMFKKVYPKVKNEESQDSILFMVAESYRLSNNFGEAVKWYEKLVNTRYPNPRIIYSYGLLLKNFEQYEEAGRKFYDFLFEMPANPDGKREMEASKLASVWKNNPEKFTIKNLSELNTSYSDYAPFFVKNKLIWSSSRTESTGNEIFEWTGQKCADFFEAEKAGYSWKAISKLKGNVNTNYNEGVAWIDTSYTTMYLTLCNGRDGKSPGCKIYVSYQNDTGWSTPELLPFCKDDYSYGHPAMTADGKRLYFASDMPGGLGQKDIYYIEFNKYNNTWGQPTNLGKNVNTAEDDMFPYIHDNGTLYFASKGWMGMGGLDIFKTIYENGQWQMVENLKYPINSGGDDFGISFVPASQQLEGEPIAYFSSNRIGGKGDDDLYSITIKPFRFMLKPKLVNKQTKNVISAAVITITDSVQAERFNLRTTIDGTTSADLPINEVLWVNAEKEMYFTVEPISISTKDLYKDSVLELIIYLEPLPQDDMEITLDGILYDLDKAELRPESKLILDSLVILLNKNPKLVIELASHTDSRASAEYNLKLSQRRAESCVNYLVSKGINKIRLKPVGYGETRLINDCEDDVDCTEEEHQLNRRTTFRIISNDFSSGKR